MNTTLIVLDYATGDVTIYLNVENTDSDGFEKFIEDHGHSIGGCEWMARAGTRILVNNDSQ